MFEQIVIPACPPEADLSGIFPVFLSISDLPNPECFRDGIAGMTWAIIYDVAYKSNYLLNNMTDRLYSIFEMFFAVK